MFPLLLNRKPTLALLLLSLVLLVSGSSLLALTYRGDEGEVNLDSVPSSVLEAVYEAKPGVTITGAEFEREGGVDMYEITGVEGGVEYEFDVSPEGDILDIIVDDDSDDENLKVLGYILTSFSCVGLVYLGLVRYYVHRNGLWDEEGRVRLKDEEEKGGGDTGL
jgi:hypothetical protein